MNEKWSESAYDGARVMVTGGAGFIGSNLARRLVELGSDVLVVDPLLPHTGANCANLKELDGKLKLRTADLRDERAIAELVDGQDIIFNLAGRSSHIDSMRDPLGDLGSNVHGHVVLLDSCRRLVPKAKIVFASTRQIYGRPTYCPVDESHPVIPVDVNGINKSAGENYHTLYYKIYGLHTVCLRLTNTFGPGMRISDARQNFLGIWIRRVVEDESFEVWGGMQKRDLTYVDDVVEAFLAAGVCSVPEHRVFNIGGSPAISLSALGELLVKVAGSGRLEKREFPEERRRIDLGDYWTDDNLFREATGWSPKVMLADGLARTVAFYRGRLHEYI